MASSTLSTGMLAEKTFRVPYRPGKLTGPFDRIKHLGICFSMIDEHIYQAGAEPTETFLGQLKGGPYSWPMFFSCVTLALPGAIHLYKHEHTADILAGIAMFMVAITSPLCDAFCVYAAVYDDGSGDIPYRKTGKAVGMSAEDVAAEVGRSDAAKEILAPDGWNNLTRLLDRSTCMLVALPAMLYYTWRQRPPSHFPVDTLMLAVVIASAWILCAIGQRFRMKHPCAIHRVNGNIVLEQGWEIHMLCHEMWHFLLVLGFTANSLYRPNMDLKHDRSPFWVGLTSGVTIGLIVGIVLTVAAFRIAAIFQHSPRVLVP